MGCFCSSVCHWCDENRVSFQLLVYVVSSVVVSSCVMTFLYYLGGADAYAKKELGAEHYRKQYRSNLSKVIAFVEDLTLKPAHIALLQRTPFYNFLEPFINKRVTTKSVTGTQKGLVKILLTYDRKQKAFIMGGQKMTITLKEVELIFGIPSGNKEVDMSQSSIFDSAFGRRKFAGYKKVTAADLRVEIEECME